MKSPLSLLNHPNLAEKTGRENLEVLRSPPSPSHAPRKLTVNFLAFPSVKFRKIWQIGSNCFTLVGARFTGKSITPGFCSGERHKYEKKD